MASEARPSEDRRTLILTGASRGIGHATVKRFASAGWRVITCSRHAFPENCPWAAGPEDHIQVDLSDPADTMRAAGEMRERLTDGKLLRVAFASILTMLALPANAQLHSTGATCRNIFDTGRILTRQDAWHEHQYDGGMLRVCTLKNGKLHSATVYSAPRKNALGLCSIRSEDVTILRRKDGSYYQPHEDPLALEGYSIAEYLLPYDGASCPRADDERYIVATDVPDGVFLELHSLWKTMRQTPDAFGGMLSLDDAHDRAGADDFKRALADPAVSARLVLTAIVAERTGVGGPAGMRSTVFKLVVHDRADWYEWYELAIDRTPQGGWRIVGVDLPAV